MTVLPAAAILRPGSYGTLNQGVVLELVQSNVILNKRSVVKDLPASATRFRRLRSLVDSSSPDGFLRMTVLPTAAFLRHVDSRCRTRVGAIECHPEQAKRSEGSSSDRNPFSPVALAVRFFVA